MKVALSATEPGLSATVDPRFGRARCFVVIDMDSNVVSTSDNTMNQSMAHGAGIQAAKTVVDTGAKIVITGHVGPKAMASLRAAGVQVYQVAGGSVQQAVEQYKQGLLVQVPA